MPSPDAVRGVVPKAFLILKPGQAPSPRAGAATSSGSCGAGSRPTSGCGASSSRTCPRPSRARSGASSCARWRSSGGPGGERGDARVLAGGVPRAEGERAAAPQVAGPMGVGGPPCARPNREEAGRYEAWGRRPESIVSGKPGLRPVCPSRCWARRCTCSDRSEFPLQDAPSIGPLSRSPACPAGAPGPRPPKRRVRASGSPSPPGSSSSVPSRTIMCRCGFSRRSDDVLCTTVTAPLLAPGQPCSAARGPPLDATGAGRLRARAARSARSTRSALQAVTNRARPGSSRATSSDRRERAT